MSRENKFTAIILKKQPYREGDEIITFFTRENGKVRALAKSVKLQKSRLQQRLQSLFLVELMLSHGQMPKIISVSPTEVFLNLRENLTAVKIAFYAVELALKFTPDEHKNEPLFDLLLDFFRFLDFGHPDRVLNLGLSKFKLEILESLGLAIRFPVTEIPGQIYFSSVQGGFSEQKPGATPVPISDFKLFLQIKQTDFMKLANLKAASETGLQNLLSQFVEYQLERKPKSEKYLQP